MADDLDKEEGQGATSLEKSGAPLTEGEFLAKLDDLVAAAQAAGLRRVPFMVAKHVARKGFGVIEELLDAADQAYNKKK